MLGFLVSRAAFRSAIMAPEFIALSLSLGLAIFVLMLLAFARWEGRPIPTPSLLRRMRGLLALLIAVSLYMVAVQHLTGIYMAERRAVERFMLLDGGIYTFCLWGGFVLLGSVVPLVLLLTPATGRFPAVLPCACGLVVLGGLALLYSLVIGGEAFPLELFPGKTISSSAFDGVVAIYSPSLPEVFLGLGGMGVAGLLVTMGTWVLPLLPERAGAENSRKPCRSRMRCRRCPVSGPGRRRRSEDVRADTVRRSVSGLTGPSARTARTERVWGNRWSGRAEP